MTDKLTKFGNSVDSAENSKVSAPDKTEAGQEILDTKLNIAGGINQLGESNEDVGVFSEEQKKVGEQSGSTQKDGRTSATNLSTVKEALPVETMIKQTIEAIEVELKNTEEEIRILRKTRDASMFVLNDKVKRVRFLNNLVTMLRDELKRAAKLAEDYVKGLWNQFVNKTN